MAKKSKSDIWFPLYIGDYLSDTMRLTAEQHGAYLLLLMDYWKSGSLPDDDSVLSSICRLTPAEWKKRVRPALVTFFAVADGKWTHSRVEKEMLEASKRKDDAEGKARNAARCRWLRKELECHGYDAHLLAGMNLQALESMHGAL